MKGVFYESDQVNLVSAKQDIDTVVTSNMTASEFDLRRYIEVVSLLYQCHENAVHIN